MAAEKQNHRQIAIWHLFVFIPGVSARRVVRWYCGACNCNNSHSAERCNEYENFLFNHARLVFINRQVMADDAYAQSDVCNREIPALRFQYLTCGRTIMTALAVSFIVTNRKYKLSTRRFCIIKMILKVIIKTLTVAMMEYRLKILPDRCVCHIDHQRDVVHHNTEQASANAEAGILILRHPFFCWHHKADGIYGQSAIGDVIVLNNQYRFCEHAHDGVAHI